MKRVSGWVALLVVCGWASGCGGGSPDSPDASPDTPDARPDSPDAAPDTPDAGPDTSDMQKLRALVEALPGAPDDAARAALVDAFFRDVAYSGGFPIREGGSLGFAYFDPGDAGGAFSVAGDFNGWDPAAAPLARPAASFPFYYAIVPVSEPLPRTLYKFVHGGTDWFADPMARRFGYDDYGEYSLAEAGGAASHLERWPRFSNHAGALEPRDLLVYVPHDLPPGGARVLYLHDGQNLFDPGAFWGGWQAQQAADGAIASGVAPFLMVGVPNTAERFDEYTPVTELVGGSLVGGRADEYVAFLADGIKPFIDARYPTLPGPADTGVAGSSLGGVISTYALWARPDVFGHAASLSGAFWWGSGSLTNPTMMDYYASDPPPAPSTFYLDSGGNDGGGCLDSDGDGVHDDGPDSDGYCQTLDMRDTLIAVGFDPVYRWTPDAQHNEAAWAARFPGVLTDWFPGQ